MELGRGQIQNLKVKSKKWKLKQGAFSYKKMFVVCCLLFIVRSVFVFVCGLLFIVRLAFGV